LKNNKSSSLTGIENKTMFDEKDIVSMIKGVACLIHTELVESLKNKRSVEKDSNLYILSEEHYFNEPTSLEVLERLSKAPTPLDIENFIKALMDLLCFSPGCIISQIYMNRLTGNSDISVNIFTWRPLVLITILLAQKMWDEDSKTNSDFSLIYPFFEIEHLNQLEMTTLELIKYNTEVKFSQFVNFYLTIKELVTSDPVECYVNLEMKEKLKIQSKKFSLIVKSKANTIIV
jgi:hypothetical protein